MGDCQLPASECAAKLAPYLHPRLAAVEVKTGQTQPFVIRMPAVETDADRWARASDTPGFRPRWSPGSAGRAETGLLARFQCSGEAPNAKLINPKKSDGSGE